jgi:hypothetical protein
MHTFLLDKWLVVRKPVKVVRVLQECLLLGDDSFHTRVFEQI